MDNQPKVVTPRLVILLAVFVVAVPLLPLLISRRWSWWEAWVFALISLLGFAVSRGLVAQRYPDLIAERSRFLQHEDAAPWDKILSPLLGLLNACTLVVVGIDALNSWSPLVNFWLKMISLVFILLGYVLGSYALIENRYFSGMVRIQTERNHQVISTGPYRWLRHPGYAGAIMTYLGIPLFLNSWWAFLPTAILLLILIVRTHLEDSFLQESLAGYRAYAQQVRYRLVPGVW